MEGRSVPLYKFECLNPNRRHVRGTSSLLARSLACENSRRAQSHQASLKRERCNHVGPTVLPHEYRRCLHHQQDAHVALCHPKAQFTHDEEQHRESDFTKFVAVESL